MSRIGYLALLAAGLITASEVRGALPLPIPSLFLVVVSLSPSLLVASPSMTYTRYNIPSRRA